VVIIGMPMSAPLAAYGQQPIRITADLTEAPRKLYHADIDLPVHPGPAAFTTPKWVPGVHRPTGPVQDITGVVFTANGRTLPWRRDDVDLYQYHVDVPHGVTTLHAHLDCIVTSRADDKIAVLEWEKLLLYPANTPVRDIPIQPSVTVLPGWGIGTALQAAGSYDPNARTGGTTQFQPTNVEQLEDSPVMAGEYFHEFPLAPEVTPKHYLDVAGDSPEDVKLSPEILNEVSNLVREAGVAYGSRHYTVYHFLLTLSDVAGDGGLEHGQSSNNGTGETAFRGKTPDPYDANLLPHEFTHSWNGKYRRDKPHPPDFAGMEQGGLLWVYEGMTQYMGNVLAARSGFETQAQYRDGLAASAAWLDHRSGRLWRSTEDVSIAASILRGSDPTWSDWRRGQDYYQDGELLWLDVDTKIRELTNDQKSIRDFHRIFLGKDGNAGPLIVPYDRAELIADLNQVVAYDWAKFFHDRVDSITPHADLDGIERGGYRLTYQDHPSDTESSGGGAPDVWYSLGFRMTTDCTVLDVRRGGPADKGKLAPGQKIIAIDSRVPGRETVHDAIVTATSSPEPIHLLIQSESYIKPIDIDYHDGEKFPVLVRDDSRKDYLDEITTPMVKASRHE
jgi:predicted metalloprotease with PDZ domain